MLRSGFPLTISLSSFFHPLTGLVSFGDDIVTAFSLGNHSAGQGQLQVCHLCPTSANSINPRPASGSRGLTPTG
ncbi:hypothetical protein F5X68DRAFT_198621 [Plectosphaerella plurivora]|uniref:Uncharacterized protein n=1 Tax=Plectosphaerella plurivora TaxID=936078 RepID=A0A9P8VMV8_9PEZI|nr:hypothetical protein F5X68DRAFT_198621 [Plectosphaerella plurivora]